MARWHSIFFIYDDILYNKKRDMIKREYIVSWVLAVPLCQISLTLDIIMAYDVTRCLKLAQEKLNDKTEIKLLKLVNSFNFNPLKNKKKMI